MGTDRRTDLTKQTVVFRNFATASKNVSEKFPLYRVEMLAGFAFLKRFSKNTLMSNFLTVRPVGAELFLGDGQT